MRSTDALISRRSAEFGLAEEVAGSSWSVSVPLGRMRCPTGSRLLIVSAPRLSPVCISLAPPAVQPLLAWQAKPSHSGWALTKERNHVSF